MTDAQREWLATFDRKTGFLSLHVGRICGYRDLIRLGYVANRGSELMPELFITAKGLIFLERNGSSTAPTRVGGTVLPGES